MPYKAVVFALEFLERESEMASRRGASRCESITLEEFVRRVQDDENDCEGLESDEESEIDQQLYDMDEDRR